VTARQALAALPLLFAAAGLTGACSRTDAERQADQTYAGGRFADALSAYQALAERTPDGRLWAKIAATALRVGQLGTATDAYLHLAGEDPTRVREAAAGLEAVARAAERRGDRAALHEAVIGLQTLVPDGVPGRYALVLAQQPDAEPDELVLVLPGAIAAAPDQSTVDSLLLRYGQALQSTAGCGQALLQYRAVVRRSQDSTLRTRAKASAGQCAFGLGQRAQSAGRDDDAALWYAEAARADTASVTGRRALVGFGDVRLRQGDTLAAALAYQAAASASPPGGDSLAGVATSRLAQIGLTPPPDAPVPSSMP
jgi:tetratricopeptide (TPR) repeat protein